MRDYVGSNVTRAKRKAAIHSWLIAALVVGGLAFFTMILWSV